MNLTSLALCVPLFLVCMSLRYVYPSFLCFGVVPCAHIVAMLLLLCACQSGNSQNRCCLRSPWPEWQADDLVQHQGQCGFWGVCFGIVVGGALSCAVEIVLTRRQAVITLLPLSGSLYDSQDCALALWHFLGLYMGYYRYCCLHCFPRLPCYLCGPVVKVPSSFSLISLCWPNWLIHSLCLVARLSRLTFPPIRVSWVGCSGMQQLALRHLTFQRAQWRPFSTCPRGCPL